GFFGGTDDEAGGALAFQLRQHLSSSSIRSAESVLALVPSRSNNSQATPSASRVSLKFLYGPAASGVGPSSSTRSPRAFMIRLSMLTPSLSASRRPARRRYIR